MVKINQGGGMAHAVNDLVKRFTMVDKRVSMFSGIYVGHYPSRKVWAHRYGATVEWWWDDRAWEPKEPEQRFLFISPKACENEVIRDFIVGHELGHLYLESLWPLPRFYRSTMVEMYCDFFSFELNAALDDRDVRQMFTCLDLLSMGLTEFRTDEFMTRLIFMESLLDKFAPTPHIL